MDDLDDDWVFRRKLNLNLLYALDAILHARTLTEAGRRVHLTQPAMSLALKQLRNHFGDQLVEYTAGQRILSPLAEALRPNVRTTLRDADELFGFSIDFDPQTADRTISISASEIIEAAFLSNVVQHLSRIAPKLKFRLLPFDATDPTKALTRDADMILLPASMADDRFEKREIIIEQLMCMVWEGNPNVDVEQGITPEYYEQSRHVAVLNQQLSSWAIDDRGDALIASRDIVVQVSHHASIPSIVINNDFVATGSSWLFQHYASLMPLTVFPAPFETRIEPVVAQWTRTRSKDPLIEWLVGGIRQAMHADGLDQLEERAKRS